MTKLNKLNKLNQPKTADLEFARSYTSSSITERMEFFKDDEYLEIITTNFRGDHVIMILDPNEINKLKELLKDYETQ